MTLPCPSLRPALVALTALACLTAPAAAVAITGVCPDGSMFIVKKAADIPCARAKQVDPQDMPPIRPHYLPRPYAWELHQQEQDPNNPYNLVDQGDQQRAYRLDTGDEPQRLGEPALTPPQAAPQQHTAPPPRASGPLPAVATAPASVEPLSLSVDEIRDLGLIVDLTQDRIPARLTRGEPPSLTLDLAHSRAFEARLHDWYAGESLGPVVLFKATALGPEDFHANLTFVQGHAAHTPERRDPRAFGLLDGSLGAQPAGGAVLGYAVLPPDVDLGEPMDVYWNDRRISVVLQP